MASSSADRQRVWLDTRSDRVHVQPMTPSANPHDKITYLKDVQSQANRLKSRASSGDKAGVEQLMVDIDRIPDTTMRSLVRVLRSQDDAREVVEIDAQMRHEPAIYYLHRIFSGLTRCIDEYTNPARKKHRS